MNNQRELFVELNDGRNSRKATGIEITKSNTLQFEFNFINEQIKNLKRKQEALLKTCDHKVFHDEPGWPYDIRICNGCGKGLGFI